MGTSWTKRLWFIGGGAGVGGQPLGPGGHAIQLPATFRDPASRQYTGATGPTSRFTGN